MLAGIADNSQGTIDTAIRAARGDPPTGIGGELLCAEVLSVRSANPLQRNRRAGRLSGQGVLDGNVNRGIGAKFG